VEVVLLSAVLAQVLQSLVVLLGAPLYAGVLARAETIVESKRGASLLQPYRDLAKLLRTGSATSDQASWVCWDCWRSS
jgi:formate hydrogenlyase subunit 4